MFGNWVSVSPILRQGTLSIFLLCYFLLNASLAFQSTIGAIDDVLIGMTDINPAHRLDAKEALDRLRTVICSMTPESLLIKPVVIET